MNFDFSLPVSGVTPKPTLVSRTGALLLAGLLLAGTAWSDGSAPAASDTNNNVIVNGDLVIDGQLTVTGGLRVAGDLLVGGRIVQDVDGDSGSLPRVSVTTPASENRGMNPGVNPSAPAAPAAEDIFVQLWRLDQARNGLSVTLRDENGQWADTTAAIRLDEQEANIRAADDAAPNDLLIVHDATKLSRPTWITVKALFDNYRLKEGEAEDQFAATPVENAVEDAEINAFLDAVLATDVMKTALDYINAEDMHGGADLSQADFKAMLANQWFRTYTNFFDKTKPTKHASGFEHVFVGEHNGNKIGGYHFWWKFVLDQQAGQIETFGHRYNGLNGDAYPWLATFRMRWAPEPGVDITDSNPKGFFVGPSPELMMAYGTLALLYEKQNQERHPHITLDDGHFELVSHASTDCTRWRDPAVRDECTDTARGDQIRSSFPILKRIEGPLPDAASILSVDQALAEQEGALVAVSGVIQAAENGEFGLRLAESLTASRFLAVKLDARLRAAFSPVRNPSAIGTRVLIEGTRGSYNGHEGIRPVTRITAQ